MATVTLLLNHIDRVLVMFLSWCVPGFVSSGAIRALALQTQGYCLDSLGRHLCVNTLLWIPFGDHPLKLERYRED